MGSMFEFDSLMIIISCAIGMFLVAVAGALLHRYLTSRRVELLTAQSALDEHFKALNYLLEDPEINDEVTDFLYVFSQSVGRQEIALRVSRLVMSGMPPRLDPEKRKRVDHVFSEINRLTYRKDLEKAFAQVFSQGFFAMMLRWPETGSSVTIARKLSSDCRDEASNRKVAEAVTAFYEPAFA